MQDAESRLASGELLVSVVSNGLQADPNAAHLRPFPLDGYVGENDNLGCEMMKELEESWNTNEKLRNAASGSSTDGTQPSILHALFLSELEKAREGRAAVER